MFSKHYQENRNQQSVKPRSSKMTHGGIEAEMQVLTTSELAKICSSTGARSQRVVGTSRVTRNQGVCTPLTNNPRMGAKHQASLRTQASRKVGRGILITMALMVVWPVMVQSMKGEEGARRGARPTAPPFSSQPGSPRNDAHELLQHDGPREPEICCLRCKTKFSQKDLQKGIYRNTYARQVTGAEVNIRTYDFGEQLERDEMDAIKESSAKDAIMDKSGATPTTERGYQTHETKTFGKGKWYTFGTSSPIQRDGQDLRSEIFACPECGFEMVIKDAEDGTNYFILDKKFNDKMWKLGLTVGSLSTGIGLANYAKNLRMENVNGEAQGLGSWGHFFFFLGVIIILVLLLRGHAWQDGNGCNVLLFTKGFGLVSGIVGSGCVVAALDKCESELSFGNDLAFKDMWDAQTHLMAVGLVFVLIAISIIIFVNFMHNRKFNGATFLAGLSNFGLAISLSVGTASFGDVCYRLSLQDATTEIGAGTFLLTAACLYYVVVWLLWRVVFNKGEKRGWKIATIVSAGAMVGSTIGFIYIMQKGFGHVVEQEQGALSFVLFAAILLCGFLTYLLVRKSKGKMIGCSG